MYMDFSGILFLLTVSSGLLYLIDIAFFRKKRIPGKKASWLVETAKELFPVFLLVFIIRTFIAEPYRIPSGSMKPTLLEGDFVLVSKWEYGWYIPIIDKRITWVGRPVQRGDVVVFRYPPDPSKHFIKRVIGLPGDTVTYDDKLLFVNGELIHKNYLDSTYTQNFVGQPYFVREYEEQLFDKKHRIYERPIEGVAFSGKVPEGQYFVMGDNRDDSGDSRIFGFVPDSLMKGRAFRILFSVDVDQIEGRWNRIGDAIE